MKSGRTKKLGFSVGTTGTVTVALTDSGSGDAHRFVVTSGRRSLGSATGSPVATWSGQLAAGSYSLVVYGPATCQVTVTTAG